MRKIHLLLTAFTLVSASIAACTAAPPSTDDAATGGSTSAVGGFSNSSGGTQAIDLDALAKNCDGLVPAQDEPCGEPGLVCKDERSVNCVCGGIAAIGSGQNGPRQWECYIIGSNLGTGGSNLGGSPSTTGGESGTGGADPSGGADMGGMGGDLLLP